MTHVEVTGLHDAHRFIKAMGNKKLYENALRDIVKDTAELMRGMSPVLRGFLEESIKVIKIGDGRYVIVVSVPYAMHMEYGTKYFPVGTPESPRVRTSEVSGKTSYHPFMRTAVYMMDDEYGKYISRILLYADKSARVG